MLEEKVTQLLDEVLEKNPSLFLIDLTISADNKIKIIIDGDKGVTLEDCITVSRGIEHNLDREEEDFSLEVTSAGATAPMVNSRQYNKNIGRKLEVKTVEELLEGNLTAVTDETIVLTWKSREAKPVGKGKVTVTNERVIAFDDIVEARVIITF
ncbi:ribosome assembly cofactor RimP [Zhouia sp. PK063]|uniref:ribosome assembly cofactor RimP n=1 Tax=Zhouia sp. PK063 TaxID=3373602 RepID=UPI0037B3E262